MSTKFDVEHSLNKVLDKLFRANGIKAHLVPCACQRPITDNGWTIQLPNDISPQQWKDPRFRLVVHSQDFASWYGKSCLELLWLEKQFTQEQLKKVIFVHWDHGLQKCYTQGYISCIEFPSHSYELVSRLKQNWNAWKHIYENKNIKYNWMCLNGRPREYRNNIYNLLKDESSGFVSHSKYNPVPCHPYDNYDFNNVDNFIKIGEIYQQSRMSIVTESIYEDHPGIITEKTLLAIAAKHPFMCIGHKGIHQEIKERGFQLYDDLFDLSFDNQPKHTRMYSAIDNNLNVLRQDIDLTAYQQKIDYNFDYLMNDYLPFLIEHARQQLLDHLVKF